MRQHQLFDLRIGGNLSDDGGRHMQPPLHPCSAFRYSVMGDEQVRVFCEVRKAITLSIRISAEDDAFASNFDAPSERRKRTMSYAHSVQGHVGVAEDEDWPC